MQPDSHCSWCGAPFEDGAVWPRTCSRCGKTAYRNPLPVAVLLVPVDGGLLCVRRDRPPRRGMLALPGGYIGLGETWQQAAARECREETGLAVDPAEIRAFRVESASDDALLVFGLADERTLDALPPFVPNDEVSERVVIDGPRDLAFELHSHVAAAWFLTRDA